LFLTFPFVPVVTHAALDIFELGQDVEGEAIRLASGSIAAVHEVPESQNQAENPLHRGTVLQRLRR